VYNLAIDVQNCTVPNDSLINFTEGNKFFELTNHLGNVLATVSDKRMGVADSTDTTQVGYYTANVVTANDYYPFGMEMPGRQFALDSSALFRYGFNNKEKSDEIEGAPGVDYDYGARIYDARVGRFLTVDPLTPKYPELTPYQFAGNRPIQGIDLDGLEFLDELKSRMNTYYQAEREAQLKPRETVSAYHAHSLTQKWGDSKNFFAELTYGIANAPYTTGQQLVRGITGQEYIHNIDGTSYSASGPFDEKQRASNFVNTVSLLIPGAEAEGQTTELLNNAGAKIETDLSEQVTAKVTNRIGETGKVGEKYLQTLGGESQVYFKTSLGGRFVDQLVDDVAYESKVGYTTLTKDAGLQIAKDAELLRTPGSGVKKVVWTFFESPVTGKAGASQPLLKALKEAGIETQVIKNVK
jgi:RHS repeat-associated protein